MRLSCLLPFIALLAGCPTPPEAGPQGGNQPANAGGGNNAGGNNAGGNNAGGNNAGGNNAGGGSEGANGPSGPPPEGSNNGPGGPPPEGGGDGSPIEGGEGGPGGPGGEGGGQNGPGGEGGGGQNGPGGEGGGNAGNNGDAPGVPDGPPTPPDVNAPPIPEAGDPINASILIQLHADDQLDPGGMQSQDQIKSDEHFTFSGTATCNSCTESLVLRAVPFVSPDQKPDSKARYTTITLSGAGEFSIAVPVGESALALELVVDADGNGVPTKGERFAVLELGGQLVPNQNRTGLELDATKREFDDAFPINKEGSQVGEVVEGAGG